MKGNTYEEIQSWVSRHDFPWNWKTFYWFNAYEKDFNIDINRVPYLVIRNKNGKMTFNKSGTLHYKHISELAQDMLKSNN